VIGRQLLVQGRDRKQENQEITRARIGRVPIITTDAHFMLR